MERDVFIRAFDILKGTNIYKYYNFYNKTLQWNRKQIEIYQFKKFKLLIDHAYKNVPFYKDRLKNIGFVPNDIRSLEDIKYIPLLTRKDLQENTKKLIDQNAETKRIIRGGSSGTTGIPIQFFHDFSAESAGIAAGYACWKMSGWQFGKKGVHIWGNLDSIQKWNRPISKLKRFAYNQKYIASPLLNKINHLPQLIEEIKTFQPHYIDGYANSIYTLANHIKSHKINFPKCKLVLTTAENLLYNQKLVIEEVLGPVVDSYGCSEINGIATKPTKSERYYIFEPHVIVESTNSENHHFKEIVVTDLDNKTMPFIRYKIGDLIDNIYPGSDNNEIKFSYFKSIDGRSADVINLGNGKCLLPVNIFGGTFIRQFKEIKRHKTIWNNKKLTFIFEVKGDIDRTAVNNKINNIIKEYEVDFEIQYVSQINHDGRGKYNYVEIIKD